MRSSIRSPPTPESRTGIKRQPTKATKRRPVTAATAAVPGLKTSGYKFTKGASCVDMGYKDCGRAAGRFFYKTCPPK